MQIHGPQPHLLFTQSVINVSLEKQQCIRLQNEVDNGILPVYKIRGNKEHLLLNKYLRF